MKCCEVKCWLWIWSREDVVMERRHVERVIRWCVTVINMSEWLTRLCAADVSERVIDSWWWLTRLCAADVSAPDVDKQLDGCCDVVLWLRRSSACSHGLLAHVVAYTVSYCLAEAADAGETLIVTNEYSSHTKTVKPVAICRHWPSPRLASSCVQTPQRQAE